jgi:hypothetical protein
MIQVDPSCFRTSYDEETGTGVAAGAASDSRDDLDPKRWRHQGRREGTARPDKAVRTSCLVRDDCAAFARRVHTVGW